MGKQNNPKDFKRLTGFIKRLGNRKRKLQEKLDAEFAAIDKQLIEAHIARNKADWYEEETKMVAAPGKRSNSKDKVPMLIGWVLWNEDFVDEDNGEVITIERRRICMRDGKLTNEWGIVIKGQD